MSTITDVRTELPELVKATFKGFGEANDRMATSWGWAPLRAVISIARFYFNQHSLGELQDYTCIVKNGGDIFDRYGFLNGDADGKPLFTWARIFSTYTKLVINGNRPMNPLANPDLLYIPMGWAKNIISASEGGFERITCEVLDTGLRYGSKDKSITRSRLIGHKKDTSKHEVVPDGSGGYRYLPLS